MVKSGEATDFLARSRRGDGEQQNGDHWWLCDRVKEEELFFISNRSILVAMEDTDVDMGSLPEDVKEKLAELALELSEGRQNVLFISLLAHPKHIVDIKLGFNFY